MIKKLVSKIKKIEKLLTVNRQVQLGFFLQIK